MSWILRRRKCQEKEHETALLRNGATLLKALITSCNGKRNPFRNFSAKELKIATNNYDPQLLIYNGAHYQLYKSLLQKRPISVLKFRQKYRDYSFKNVVFPSQINHKNVLKLIGCCLETELPTLVFEYVQSGTLADRICAPQSQQLEWKHRLKTAMEIANAVTYLHIGLPRPIVFGDIRPGNILLDEQGNPKLFDFSCSESIPEGETHIERDAVHGTVGYIAPEYNHTLKVNERCDVYGFGVLLLTLLTGRKPSDVMAFEPEENRVMGLLDSVKKYNENNRIVEIVDPIIVQDGVCLEREQQLHTFKELAMKCISTSPEARPDMIDAAKQLRQLYLSP